MAREAPRRAVLLLACVGIALPATARGDEIVVQGDRLRATVTNVTAEVVEIETIYGEGKLSIPIEDVESLSTEGAYFVAYGEDEQSHGRIVGIEDGALLVGDSRDQASHVPIDSLQLVLSDQAVEESPLLAAKRKLRYWTGSLELGFSLAQGTVDTENLNAALMAERRKGPTRLLANVGVLYGAQQKRGGPSTTTADQYSGRLRGEYDLTERFFPYGDGAFEYNGVQRLSIRGVPEAGVGYKFWKSEEKDSTDFLAGTIGGSWVYERFFGGLERNYFAIAFGAELQAGLPYDATLTGSASYLPAVDDFTRDFLIRSKGELKVPVWEQLSFYFSIADDYDNTPAAGTSFNYLTTSVGLSAGL